MAEPAESRGEMTGAAGVYAWRELGEGPPLVLINGYAATCDDWDPTFLETLARGSRLICPDNRGLGASELGDEPLSVGAMAADVVALLDHLGIGRAPVAGWSMGGFVAQQVARTASERVGALVLLSTDPGGREAVRCPDETWARLTDRSGTPREQATRIIALLFPPGLAEQVDRDFGDVVADARAALSPAALDGQESAMDAWHSGAGRERDADPLPGPVLAAAGTLDEVIPAANALALGGAADGWVARFPGAGHAFMAQEPARLSALIETFLGR